MPGDPYGLASSENGKRMASLIVRAHEIGDVLDFAHEPGASASGGAILDTLISGVRRTPDADISDWSSLLDALIAEP